MSNYYIKRILALFLLFCSFVVIVINYQNELLLKLFPEKIWVHRVNFIDKLQEINTKFSGVEVDVIFIEDKNIFDVNHPPAQSIDLSLFKYLSSIKLTSNNSFWIDFKNLSEDNMENSCLKLDSICKELKLNREQFIIESTSHPQYL